MRNEEMRAKRGGMRRGAARRFGAGFRMLALTVAASIVWLDVAWALDPRQKLLDDAEFFYEMQAEGARSASPEPLNTAFAVQNEAVVGSQLALQELESANFDASAAPSATVEPAFTLKTSAGDLLHMTDGEIGRITRADGTVLAGLEFDADGRITDADLRLADGTVQLIRSGAVTASRLPDGTDVLYNAQGRVEKAVTPDGREILYAYVLEADGAVRSVTVTSPEAVSEYDAQGRVLRSVFAVGKKIFYDQGVLERVEESGRVYEYARSEAGDEVRAVLGAVTDAAGDRYELDEEGIVRSAVRADGTRIDVTRWESGAPADARVTTAAGETFEYTDGRLTRSVDASGQVSTLTSGPDGTTVVTPALGRTVFYDAAGNALRASFTDGSVTEYHAAGVYRGYVSRQVSASGVVTLYDYVTTGTGLITASKKEPVASLIQSTKYASSAAISYKNNPSLTTTFSFGAVSADAVIRMNAANTASANVAVTLVPGAGSTYRFGTGAVMSLGVNLDPSKNYTAEMRWEAAGIGLYVYEQGATRPAAPQARIASKAWNPKFNLESVNTVRASYVPSSGAFTKNFSAVEKTGAALVGSPSHRTVFKLDSSSTTNKVTLTAAMPAVGAVRETFTFTWASGRWTLVKSSYNSTTKKTVNTTTTFAQALTVGREYAAELRVENGKISLYAHDAAAARPATAQMSAAAFASAATVTAALVNATARVEAFRNNAAVTASALRAPSVPADTRGRAELARIASDAVALVKPEVVKAEYRAGKLTSAVRNDGTAVEFENGLLRRAGGASFLFEESVYGNLASMTVETSGLKTSYDAKGRLRSVTTKDGEGVEQTVWYEEDRVTRIEKADGTVISDIIFEDAPGAAGESGSTGTIRDAVVRTTDGSVRRYLEGRILEERKADGTVTTFADGRPAESRMADGRVYVYRTMSAQQGLAEAAGAVEMVLREYRDASGDRVELDAANAVPVRITRANGDVFTELEFDAAGDLKGARVQTRDVSGSVWSLRYADGELIEAAAEAAPGSEHTFSQRAHYQDGLITRLETPGQPDQFFSRVLSASGALISTRVRSGAETRSFDAAGRLVSYESPSFTAEYDTAGLRTVLHDQTVYERPVFSTTGKLVSARILAEDGTIHEIQDGRLVRTVRPDGTEVTFDAAGLVTRLVEGSKDTVFEYARDAAGRIEDVRAYLYGGTVRTGLSDLLKSGANPGYWPVQGAGGWHRLTQFVTHPTILNADGMETSSYQPPPTGDTASNVYAVSSRVPGTAARTGIRFAFDNYQSVDLRQGGFLFVKLRVENAPGMSAVRIRPYGGHSYASALDPLAKTYPVTGGVINAVLPIPADPGVDPYMMAIDFIPPQDAAASWTVAVEQAGYFELNTDLSKAHEPFLDLDEVRDRVRTEPLESRLPQASGWPSQTFAFNRFASADDRAVRMSLDADGSAAGSALADGSAFVYTSGRTNAVTASDGTVTEYFYDADGKVERTRVTPPTSASGATAAVVTRYAYGRIREVADGAGAVIYRYTYEFEGDDEITVITDARSGEVKRYSDQKLLSSLDAQGLLTTYAYSTPAGAVSEKIASSVVTWKGRELHRFTYAYADGGTRITGEDGVTKIYDASGELTHLETASGLRYKRSALTDGTGADFEEHALLSARTEDGATLFYKEDTVQKIVLKDGTTIEVGEDDGRYRNVLLKEGLVDEVVHEDGSTARYLRDEIGRLAAVDVTRAGKVYRYNPSGELVRVTDPAAGEVSEYGFRKDAQGRVTHTRVIRRDFTPVAGLELSVPLRAASYGMADGWNSSVTVDGTDYSDFNYDLRGADGSYRSRGWSIVHTDASGRVVSKGYFDPYLLGHAEAERMAAFLEAIPQGDLAVMAVADEGSKNLSARALAVVESFGSSLVRGLGYRDSFALIGRKGAPAGSAIEELKKLGEGPATASNADARIFYYDAAGSAVSYDAFADTPEMTWDSKHTFQSEGDLETFAATSSGAAGWKKNYSPEHPDSGFVYLWGGPNQAEYFQENYQNDYLSLVDHTKEKFIYYDPAYFSNYTGSFGAAMKNKLTALGYKVVTAADLKDFLTTRGADTALLMLQSVMPETVYDPFSPYSIGQRNIPREYLEAGGTIVWTHDLPFYYVARADGTSSVAGEAGLRRMLGVIPTARANYELERQDHAQSFDWDTAGYRFVGGGAAHESGAVRLTIPAEGEAAGATGPTSASGPVRARVEAVRADSEGGIFALENLMRSATVRVEADSVLELGYDLVTMSGASSQVAVRLDRDGRVLAHSGSGSWFWTGANFLPGSDTVVEFFEKGDFTELYVYPAPGPRPVHMTVRIAHSKSTQGTFYAEALRGSSSVLDLSGYEIVRNDAHETTAARVLAGPPADQPALDKSLLNYGTNVNFRQVSWSAVKDQLGSVLQPQTPIVSTYDSDGRIVSTARADRTVLTYLPGSDRLDAVYDLAGYLLTDYVYDASGDLIEIRNEGQRRALDEALFDAKRQVSLRKTEALEDQAIESEMITQSFLDQVNAQRAQLEGQRSTVQNSLNDLENQKMKGSDAKKAKSQALDQLRDALRQIDQARNAFEEDVARQLALLSGALNEKKLSIERDFSAAFARIESEFTMSLDAVALEERKAVVIDVYRTVLGRDPSAAETVSGAGQPVSALKSTLLASPDRAARAARKDAILSGLESKLDEFLSASDSNARGAYLNTLGFTAEEAVNLSEQEVTALKGFLASQSLHFAESAIDPLVELLKSEGVTITESDRTQLAVRLILIDILTGQIHPFLKEGEELLISLYALQKTSRLYAKHSSSFKLSYEDLQDFSLKNPSKHPVVHVEGKHYVNVLSVTSLEVTILDGGEVKKLSKEDFQKVWEGTTLLPDAHAPPALESKKLSEGQTRNIQGAFFWFIPAIIGAIGSIVGAVGGIIASIGSILAGIGTLIGNIVVGLSNILGGILHGIGTLTHTLFTGLKFAGTHLFGGGLTGLFAPATQGGFFGASLNTLTAGSLFKSAISIGLNYGLQRGLDALGVNPGISGVLTGFITGGYLGSITPTGFNSALFLESGLKGAVQAGSRTLLAASGLDSSVANIITTLSAPASQNGSWQTTIGGQLITINPTLVQNLASYGIQKLGSAIGLDPRIAGVIGSVVAGSIDRFITAGRFLGEDIIQSVFDGLSHGAIQMGLDFTIDKLGIDNPLLKSLASAALTRTVSSILDPNGNIIEDLITSAAIYTDKFLGNVASVTFLQDISRYGMARALETHATALFSQAALEEIHKVGGIAQIISGRAQLVDYNGTTLKKIAMTNGEGFVLDQHGNFVGTFRESHGVTEEVFGQFDTSFGKARLINGTIRQTHQGGDVSYMEVREGKVYRLVLKQQWSSSRATVERVACDGSESGCLFFDMGEGASEPIWDWELLENYDGKLDISGSTITNGLEFIRGAASFNISNGYGQSINFQTPDQPAISVTGAMGKTTRNLFGNGFENETRAEDTPDPLMEDYIYDLEKTDGLIAEANKIVVYLYEMTKVAMNAIDWTLDFNLPLVTAISPIVTLIDRLITGLAGNNSVDGAAQSTLLRRIQEHFGKLADNTGLGNNLVVEVIRSIEKLQSEKGRLKDAITFAHSGFTAPVLTAIEAMQYDVDTVLVYEGPHPDYKTHFTNPNLRQIIHVMGSNHGIADSILEGDAPVPFLDWAEFTGTHPDFRNINIEIKGAFHNDYSYDEAYWLSKIANTVGRTPLEQEINRQLVRKEQERNRRVNIFMRRLYEFASSDQSSPGDLEQFLMNTAGITYNISTRYASVELDDLVLVGI